MAQNITEINKENGIDKNRGKNKDKDDGIAQKIAKYVEKNPCFV